MGVTSGCSKYGISHIEQQRKVIYINNLIIFIVFIIFHNVVVILGVSQDSYAEEYCEENELNYVYTDSLDWLK